MPIKYKDAPCVPAPPKATPKPAPAAQPASESLLPTESLLPRREEVARKWVDEEAGLEDQGGPSMSITRHYMRPLFEVLVNNTP